MMGDNRVHYVSDQTSGGIGLTACSIDLYKRASDHVSEVTCVMCLRRLLTYKSNTTKRASAYWRKAAAANKENEALRRELVQARVDKAIMTGYLENTSSQAGYRVRYEKLRDKLSLIRQLADPEVNGIPYEDPKLPLPAFGRKTEG
jgi:hypothetical protein